MSKRRGDVSSVQPVGVEDHRQAPSRAVLVLAGAIVVAVLVTLSLGNRRAPTVAPDDQLPEVSAEQLRVPDLVGVDIGQVGALLGEAGFEAADPTVRWIANLEHTAGAVFEQKPAPGEIVAPLSQIELEVSAGGPTASPAELPAYARELLGSEFDDSEPVLISDTPAGPAYKTDALSFGTCAAVEAAGRSYRDQQYEERCPPEQSASVTGWLLDGTAFIVDRLPPGRYEPKEVSGVIMADIDDETSDALGIGRFTRLLAEAPASSTRTVNLLTIAAGPWRAQISIYEHLLAALDETQVQSLHEAASPWAADGHFVIDLAPPLRHQKPFEVPSTMSVDYGDFKVQSGCPSFPPALCDVTEELSVTFPDAVPAGVSIGSIDVGTWSQLVGAGWAVTYPDSWTVAESSLTPDLLGPTEVLSLGTFPLRPGYEACPHVPELALRDLGPTDVLVSVYRHGPRDVARPDQFSDLVMPPLVGTDFAACAERPELDVRWEAFDFEGTGAYVLVAFGSAVGDNTKAATWAVLNSFEFTDAE